ncbi:MAG: DNA polymerase II large subunit [Thermoplasmatota archaeon]
MNDGKTSETIAVSETMLTYFNSLQKDIDQCYMIAAEARKKGLDPSFNVEIPQALDLAARVEELVGPKDIAPKIRVVTKEIGNRELVSLELARYIVNGKSYKFSSTEKALDQAVRTGLAILTEGVLVAPLEGIADVKLGTNNDGSTYVDLFFSGPIRSAGGTGQAMSVLIADVVRRELGIGAYKPTAKEIERYKEEIPLYKRVQHLQYTPNADEIHQIVSQCPICINGEGTEDEEITGNRDLPRVGTNKIRGGACLVIAEGLCLKAPKILKHVSNLHLKGWEFLDILANKNKGKNDDQNEDKSNGIPSILPSAKYIGEVIAGRPVFSHPSRAGGFRLRYGRARTAGLASTAIHPAAMFLCDEFIAVGTQMKTERPGKATIGTPCSELEPPIVLLYNGDLVEISESKPVDLALVKQIVDIGEILIPYGEFLENNALLPDASYSYEWWIQELQCALQLLPETINYENIRKADEETQGRINERYGSEILMKQPSFKQALWLSETYNIPLHPYYNLFWHDLTYNDVSDLATYIKTSGTLTETHLLQIPHDDHIKEILIVLGALHTCVNRMILFDRYSSVLIHCLGYTIEENSIVDTPRAHVLDDIKDQESTVSLISRLSGIPIQAKAPIRIGTRMGRPEKAAQRKMRPPPHVLFPLGNYGSNQRLFSKAAEHNVIEVEAGKRTCPVCGKSTFRLQCSCGAHTEPIEGRMEVHEIDINKELLHAKKTLHLRTIPTTIKGVQGMISKHKTPEPVEKGVLRAKHDVTVFKDGTIRFDMTDAPITHFKPKEAHVSIERLHELGYNTDIHNKDLENNDQICELRIQDVIISKACAEYFMKIANFIDELLVRFYTLGRFYNIKKMEDLIGHLAIGLAPHTSAGSLARIIGFTDSQVCFAHPFYHAAKRRNADGDEDGLMLLMDALLNFSHEYIPDKRGGKMDLPLILTIRLDPSEVDKEAHNVDTLYRYPLSFYKATLRHAHPKDLEDVMDIVGKRLGTPLQYEHFGFTHDTFDISAGPKISRYKTLNTMMEKMNAQLDLAAKIRAVDEADVAYKVIERHFLPDILGNLKAFSKQSVRCPACNITYRRIPLAGVCRKCNGSLSLTVHEKSVKKYLDISKEIAERYHIPAYANQRIHLVEKSIDSLFISDKIKKTKLTDFF